MTEESHTALHPPIEGRIRLRCGRSIGFAEYGACTGKPIFWFHGTPGGRRQIPPPARVYAAQRDVRLIALERPGVGGSTAHLYPSIAAWAGDVEEVADRLAVDRFGLIGLSGGGPYVLACAHRLARRVVAGAVLGGVAPSRGDEANEGGLVGVAVRLAPLLELAREPLGGALWGIARSLTPLGSLVFDRFVAFMPEGDQAVYRRPEMKSMFLDDLERASRAQLLAPVYDVVQFTRPWGFALRDIRVPIRFWHGDADNIVPLEHARRMAGLVPDAELRVRTGEGHIGNLAAAEEVIATILSLWPPAGSSSRARAGADLLHTGRGDASNHRSHHPIDASRDSLARPARAHRGSDGEAARS